MITYAVHTLISIEWSTW